MILDQYIKKAFARKKSGEDSKLKSIAKAVSWRTLGTFDTILISFLITGEAKMAFSIGMIEVFSKIGLYYVHERVWERFTIKKETNEVTRPDTVAA